MEDNEDFFIEYYDGSSWVEIANYAKGTARDFMNGLFYQKILIINEGT